MVTVSVNRKCGKIKTRGETRGNAFSDRKLREGRVARLTIGIVVHRLSHQKMTGLTSEINNP